MTIEEDDLAGPEIAAFLAEHLDEMRSLTPRESVHAMDLDALRSPDITVWTVRDDGRVVACGALKALDAGHAEVKSMRTARSHQRTGLAARMLEHLIAEARRRGFTRLSLETGSGAAFLPARRLYEKYGFDYCGPFGTYRPDPNSVFLTRAL